MHSLLARSALFALLLCSLPLDVASADEPDPQQVRETLRTASLSFIKHCSKQGGYVWRYSRELSLSEGEGETGPTKVWVQPPGTPAVGMALIDVYRVTKDERIKQAIVEAARVLVRGQLRSGGWGYSIELAEADRGAIGYRDNPRFKLRKSRKNKTNITTLDDDTTPAAIRFLARVDRLLNFEDEEIHQATRFAVEGLIAAQRANGGWTQNWDRHPMLWNNERVGSDTRRASYPKEWSRTWLNDWPGEYYINDNVTGTVIETLLDVAEIYDDHSALHAAKATGQFLIQAQMPEPQPGWAQQYDAEMHPCWDRKFEPPAISGHESEEVIAALMMLHQRTGEKRFLKPIPSALAYLERSRLPNGTIARFYELRTNRPLYFNTKYDLTTDASDLPTHYGFVMNSKVEKLKQQYDRLMRSGPDATAPKPSRSRLATKVQDLAESLDDRGLWIDARGMKGFRKASQEGVIQSETFIKNVRTMIEYIEGE